MSGQENAMPINELRAIATFAKAVELGSLRRAAQAQGISPQAASQAVAQLEQHLGVRLLHRTTRSFWTPPNPPWPHSIGR
jgi:DNA-binding transcriptional LysR family regulator